MGENSAIEWTDATWNPWYGCRKVSQGCKFCYMFRDMDRYGRDPHVITRSKTTFTDPLKWLGKKPAGLKVFTCSWSDWFIEEADEWRPEAWDIIRRTPFTYQILTKRPERIRDHLPADWGDGYPNVWLGTSVENQEMADLRIRELLQIPAKTRFLSIEPMLGPVDLRRWLDSPHGMPKNVGVIASSVYPPSAWIGWIIVGGESGPHARPMHLKWVRDIRDQCVAAGVPFHFKQWGEWIPKTQIADQITDDDGWLRWRLGPRWQRALAGCRDQWGALLYDGTYLHNTTTWNGRQLDPRDQWEHTVYRPGKRAAGRELDGRTWDEFPAVGALEGG